GVVALGKDGRPHDRLEAAAARDSRGVSAPPGFWACPPRWCIVGSARGRPSRGWTPPAEARRQIKTPPWHRRAPPERRFARSGPRLAQRAPPPPASPPSPPPL